MTLEPTPAVRGARRIAHGLVGSTNAEALELARRGERGPLWVTAERQTAGRGRRGRLWLSPPGNLYASLLLPAPGLAERWPQLSFVAALAVHDAVVEVAPALAPRAAIKWPNDLLLAGAKFAGILIEGEGGDTPVVVIGIGVNCANHPVDVEYPATDLAAAGTTVLPERLFAAVARRMQDRLAQWDDGRGFSTIRRDWLARAAGIGASVRVRLAQGEVTGCFEALDESGGLVLRVPDGSISTIAAGDVFMPSPPACGVGV
jgi:BirA family transcriptional regulator, biotin operon repressor / biotin---[acetyl-CoA-carboxylase] ligase